MRTSTLPSFQQAYGKVTSPETFIFSISSQSYFPGASPYTRRRQWHPTPVLLPGKSHGWRSLEGCSPWGREESDTTERLHFHFSLSCIGEGNGNPLQCSCLENPRDGGAWWAAVYGVAQSQRRLKRLSSSSSSDRIYSGWRVLGYEMVMDKPSIIHVIMIPQGTIKSHHGKETEI